MYKRNKGKNKKKRSFRSKRSFRPKRTKRSKISKRSRRNRTIKIRNRTIKRRNNRKMSGGKSKFNRELLFEQINDPKFKKFFERIR